MVDRQTNHVTECSPSQKLFVFLGMKMTNLRKTHKSAEMQSIVVEDTSVESEQVGFIGLNPLDG